MEEEQELKRTLEEKIERANQMLIECSQLKTEWEERIEEAKQAKANYDFLIRLVAEGLSNLKKRDK